jgi:hypothetical protein
MSTSSLIKNPIKEKVPKISQSPLKPLFNSKLFLDVNINEDLDLDEFNENSDINTEDSDHSIDLEEYNCLSNELIEKLDSCDIDSKPTTKKDNKETISIVDSLLSLAENGYEFKPKNYRPPYNNNNNNNNKNNILFNKNMINNNNKNNKNPYINSILNNNNNLNLYNNINNNYYYRDQKKDWVCSFCNNLNFSFRMKCNRCKANKEESEKRKIFFINI